MFDTDSRDTPQRGGSLLSLGASGDSSRPSQSLLAATSREDDAIAKHRLARSRREAQPNPLLKAMAERQRPVVENQAPASVASTPKPRGGLGQLLTGWTRTSRGAGRGEAAVAAAEEPVAVYQPDLAPDRLAPRLDERAAATGDEFVPRRREADGERWKPLIDPMKLIGGVTRSKGLIAATTILGALIGVAMAVSTPKKYESVTELLIDPRDLKIVERDLTGSGGLTNEATVAIVENQVRVLTSGSVLNQVVDKLNLASDPEFNGESAGFGSVISSLRSLLSRQDAGAGGDNRRALAVGNLAESLTVERGGKTFVVMVSVVTHDPEKSALIANTMTEVFLTTYGKLQSDTAGRAAEELTARLDELRKAVEAAERKVETFKAENDIIDAQGRLITDEEILKLNEQLSVARAKTLEINAKAASTRQLDVDSVVGGTLPEEATSNVLVELRSQYASLKQQADRLSVKLGPRHPESQAIAAELGGAREQITAELRRIASSVQVELKRAVQLEQELASRLAQLKVRQGDLSNELVSLRELERDATAKRAVYEAFLLRARETGEQKDLNTANMSVISTAYPPLLPLGPSRAVISFAGMLLGLMAGIGLGLIRGVVDSFRGGNAFTRSARPLQPRDGGPAGGRTASETPTRSDLAAEGRRDDAERQRIRPTTPAPGPAPEPQTAEEPDTVFRKLRSLIHSSQENTQPAAASATTSGFAATQSQFQPQATAAPQPVYPIPAPVPHPAYAAAAHPAHVIAAVPPQQQAYAPSTVVPYPPLHPASGPTHHPAYAAVVHPAHIAAAASLQPQPQMHQQVMPQMQHPVGYPQIVPHQVFAPPPVAYPQPWPQQPAPLQPVAYAQPVQSYAPPPAAYAAYPAPQPIATHAYPVPAAQGHPSPVAHYYPAPPPVAVQASADAPHGFSPIDEVRASLREFRHAVHDLAEARARHRYS